MEQMWCYSFSEFEQQVMVRALRAYKSQYKSRAKRSTQTWKARNVMSAIDAILNKTPMEVL